MRYVIVGVFVVALAIIIFIRNLLIGRRNQCENAFATIDAMLKKRYDLIPNLVSVVSQYAKHESEVLKQVTQIRAQTMDRGLSSDEKVQLDNQISQAIVAIMGVVENYPKLKAAQNFLHLQHTLNEIEEQISASRRAFNAAVIEYNNSVEMFPSNLIASVLGFKKKAFFALNDQERQSVNVNTSL